MDIEDLSPSQLQVLALEKMKEENWPREYRKAARILLNDTVALEAAYEEEAEAEANEDYGFGLEDLDEDEDVDYALEGFFGAVGSHATALGKKIVKFAGKLALSPFKRDAKKLAEAGEEIGKKDTSSILKGLRAAGSILSKVAAATGVGAAAISKKARTLLKEIMGFKRFLADKTGTDIRHEGKDALTRGERALAHLKRHKGKYGLGAAALGAAGGAGLYLSKRERDNAKDGI